MGILRSRSKMAGMDLVPATAEDVDEVLRLIDAVGWVYTRAELARLIEVQPGGLELARRVGGPGGPIGCAYASAWGRLGFVGLVVVERRHRGRGLGRTLMERAILALRKRGCEAVGLDALEDAQGFYSRLGFVRAWESLRFGLRTRGLTPLEGSERAREAEPGDLPALSALDVAGWGAVRDGLLARLVEDEDTTVIVSPAEGEIEAYGAVRTSRDCVRFGPWVRGPGPGGVDASIDVLARAIETARPQTLTLGVPGYQGAVAALLDGMGAVRYRPARRMFKGDVGPAHSPEDSLAIGAAEKG